MPDSLENPQKEVVYTRKLGWMPYVIRQNDALYLEFGAGADANHEPRTFHVPITEAHLEVIRSDFKRHLLLQTAIVPLADAAGTSGPIDESAAVALLDPILLGSEQEVEALFKDIEWHDGNLIAHHANPALLKQGQIFAAMESITLESDPKLAQEHLANRRRAERGVYLSILDIAVLKYTNQYLYGGGLASRNPDAVDPELLTQVLEVIATAEQACAGMELPTDYGQDYEHNHQRDKEEWNKIKNTAEGAVKNAYPDLALDTINTVSFLICSEAASRAKAARKGI